MLNKLQQAKDRWGGRSDTIDTWLKARQQLLVQYCALAGLAPQNVSLPDASDISEFCTLLLDYCSAGHFEIYDMLTEGDDDGEQLRRETYPQISETTDNILAFSDNFSESFTEKQAASFDRQLAKVGEALEQRFALEDALIQHMFEHKLSPRNTFEA
ncbi:sigma D regulator [Aestuariibacter sp. A3R04]|uniref:sigma D regulator n=1 Tax=Aestuariibacter sp. A3R04 TaxID=2841571 RepID=UPI001C08DBAB|nr:sigma D regulator [Aestuariibacter sp. A3R04]MBU3023604.1 sigma D regulator [Aestuariibacter sp. A3R04]